MNDITHHGPVPSPRQAAWHRRETYGFIHFSMNTFTGREWGFGDEDPARFVPSRLDAAQWVAAAKAGGLKALILTAKHHDGFCLWPTATTAHSVRASPWRGGQGDVVGELATACRSAGLELGLYCSPWDRNHAGYGGPDYVATYHTQVEELLTRYGDLCEFWFDGANGGDGHYGGARDTRRIDRRTYYDFPRLWESCRRHQPNAVLFSDAGPDLRWCGNERGATGVTNWAKVRPEGFAVGEVDDMDRLAHGDADGSVWRPTEVDVSIRPGWFWHEEERPKDADELFSIWQASVGRGAGLLLNLTPDRDGLIPSADGDALAGFRRRVEAFTAGDLACGRPIKASAERPGHPAVALVDGDPATCWAAPDGITTATVELDLAGERRLRGVRLEEAIAVGQRVVAFAIDGWFYDHWLELARGTTIGAQRIVELPMVRTDRLRLRILDSQAAPVLARWLVYGD